MSRVKTWLISDKKFFNHFRAFSRKLPGHCRSCLFSPEFATMDHFSYLSYLFPRREFTKSAESCTHHPKTPTAPRVPPTSGALSLYEDRINNTPRKNTDITYRAREIASEQKIIWLFEIDKIPPRYREGLIKLLNKHRSNNFLCSVFSPRSFSYGLANESDFYFIKKRNWLPILKQLNSIFSRVLSRGSVSPNFPKKFSLREKLVIRTLYRFRRSFASLEDISSYLYGKRLTRSMHCSEVAIADLRKKLRKITGRRNVINNVRSYGYKINDKAWKEILDKQ